MDGNGVEVDGQGAVPGVIGIGGVFVAIGLGGDGKGGIVENQVVDPPNP